LTPTGCGASLSPDIDLVPNTRVYGDEGEAFVILASQPRWKQEEPMSLVVRAVDASASPLLLRTGALLWW
jgi:hypothetical protein